MTKSAAINASQTDTTVIPMELAKNITGWSMALDRAGFSDLAWRLRTDDQQGFHQLRALGLPAFRSLITSSRAFLENFEQFRDRLACESYYAILYPLEGTLPKYILLDVSSLQEVRRFVYQKVRKRCDSYVLRLSEYEANEFGGNIVSDDGLVVVEIARGRQAEVGYGTVPVWSGTLSGMAASAKYTTIDVTIRSLIWRAIKAISASNGSVSSWPYHEIRGLHFLKGYFEFAYTRPQPRESARLVFLDVKLKPEFCSLSFLKGRP